ncbi:MAG TPA: 3-isopropylmalate dehydratase small subunit [Pseudonocardiaceae bacterium]
MSPEPLRFIDGIAAPLLRNNVDTDAIAPSRVAPASLSKYGYGHVLFANWRFDENGRERADFVLNREPYRHAKVLVSGANFGCGSSRETAVWALRDYGLRAVIASSFGGIFEANCFRNGILPLTLTEPQIESLAGALFETGDPRIEIDVSGLEVRAGQRVTFDFQIPPREHRMLVEGLDTIGETLLRVTEIDEYRERDARRRPWIYGPTRG